MGCTALSLFDIGWARQIGLTLCGFAGWPIGGTEGHRIGMTFVCNEICYWGSGL